MCYLLAALGITYNLTGLQSCNAPCESELLDDVEPLTVDPETSRMLGS